VCRLAAALSTRPLSAAEFLYKAPQSLLHQSRAQKKRLQGDGWGAAWFAGGQPRLRKSPRAVFRDTALLRRVARQVKGTSFLAHIRWASNPLKLPRKELIGLPHTQPFVWKSWVFAHNGTLYIPNEVKAELGIWAPLVQGKNDSEVLFYWLLKHFEPLLSAPEKLTAAAVAATLERSFSALDKIWAECRQRYPLFPYPFHGTNCVLTNGEVLLAFCLADPRGFGKAIALCNAKQPYFELQRFVTEEAVVIASEPLDPRKTWTAFENGELLLARKNTDGIRVETARFLQENV
jgi:glutamine amidotransferase